MNDIFKETFGTADTSKQTPIEIALGVDGQGMTTAKKLYEFLELDASNYAKWFKKNIIENNFAEENTDYWVFVPKDENPPLADVLHRMQNSQLVLRRNFL